MKVHLEKFIPIESYKKFVEQLLLNLYVGDLSNSSNKVEDSFNFLEVSEKSLAEASFKLYKWATNGDELAKLIKLNENDTTELHNADDETYVKDSLGISGTYRKVLGVNWNTTANKFVFESSDIINIASKLNFTKRHMLKVSGMFFSPLGLICPILLQPKLLFRNILIQKCEWDTKVNIDVNNKCKLFLSELKTTKQIEINKHVLCCNMLDVDLHGFGDASRVASRAMVYVRSVCRQSVKVSLWTGKCCVAPVKPTTVPRLKFLACVLLSKLIVSVKKGSYRVVESSKCVLLVRFPNFAVGDQTGPERLEGLDRKSSSDYSEKCSPRVFDACAN